jgi:hypothetical protein
MVYIPEYSGGRFEDSKEREDEIILIIQSFTKVENVATIG